MEDNMVKILAFVFLFLPSLVLAQVVPQSTPSEVIRNVYSSTNVTTAAWVQLDASLDNETTAVEIFDSSGSVLKLAIGASGQEVELPFYILPGGNGRVSLLLPKGKRLSIRAVDTSATSGQLVINLLR